MIQKIFHFVIETIFWIAIFLSPFLFLGVISMAIYFSNENYIWLSIILLLVGVTLGVIWAERIRVKYGCARYMGKILSTRDIWPDEEINDKK